MSDPSKEKRVKEGMEKGAEAVDPHEAFRQDIKELVTYISREARRGKPPRRIIFTEAPIGSRKFENRRYFDEKTKETIYEEIVYDPSLFWDGPAGAFYATLWHEFGHGEGWHRKMELEDDKLEEYDAGKEKKSETTGFLLNVKYDIIVDSNNIHSRPGLVGSYRACYEYFFPRTSEHLVPRLEKITAEAELPENIQRVGGQIGAVAGRGSNYLLALKHEAYWFKEDERSGVPEEERHQNPYFVRDPFIEKLITESRQALLGVAEGRRSIVSRSRAFNEIFTPQFKKILASRLPDTVEVIAKSLDSGESTLQDMLSIEDAIYDKIRKIIAAPFEAMLVEIKKTLEENESKLKVGEAFRDEILGSLKAAGLDEEYENQKAQMEMELERFRNEISKIQNDIVSLGGIIEEIKKKKELKLPVNAEEAAKRILDALDELAALEKPPQFEAQRVNIPINKTNPEHPEHKPPPQPPAQNPEPPKQPKGENGPSKEQLAKWGIKPADDKLYRETKNLIDENALYDLINGLIRCFSEDRQRIILSDMPVGILPTARKVEALRRRYAGEELPNVRESRKIIESFMGVDIVLIIDHSGSMGPVSIDGRLMADADLPSPETEEGHKVRAARAAAISLTHAALRVNTENRRKMRQLGLNDLQVKETPPIRFLGLLFGNGVTRMNHHGWEDALESRGSEFEEQQMGEEKFVVEMMGAYRSRIDRGWTMDARAAVHALYEAFGKDTKGIKNPEERVKVFCFITDGEGQVDDMSALMRFLHGVSDEFPEFARDLLEGIEAGSSSKVEKRIRQYRDQIIAIGVGIPQSDRERNTFIQVYNEGRVPVEGDIRSSENDNVVIIKPEEVAMLPAKILAVLKAKFESQKFRQIRARYSTPSRRTGRIKR